MLLHVPATPQPGKHGSVGPALRWHNLQLARERAPKLFAKYNISMSEFAVPAGAHLHGGFVALVVVGYTSSHSLKEFKDTSGLLGGETLDESGTNEGGVDHSTVTASSFCCWPPAAAITGVFAHF